MRRYDRFAEEYPKLRTASNRDVQDDLRNTTPPVAREIVETCVAAPFKAPRYIDLLNINLNNEDLAEARPRIGQYVDAFGRDNTASHRTWISGSREAQQCRSARSRS